MTIPIDISEEAGVRTLHFGSDWIQGAMRIARPWNLELEYTREMMASLLLKLSGGNWIFFMFWVNILLLIVGCVMDLTPALLILGAGFDPTFALVLSQVVLSFGIPFALIPLVVLTAQQRTLGEFRNRPITTIGGVIASVFLVTLNAVLLFLVFTGA